MAATPAMLPLMLATAPLKVGEAAPEALPEVLLAAGVEVAAGVEPEPAGVEPEAAGVETAAEEEELLLPVAEAELEVSVAEAEEELLELEELELEVSTGGTEMGWPAEEHCWTTALETASWSISR